MRSVLVIVILSLAGCAQAPEPVQDLPAVITDPTDYSYNSTAGEHIHDYWGGKDQLFLLDASKQSTWNNLGGGQWIVAFFLPDGKVVPQGTSQLHVEATWGDLYAAGQSPNAYGDVTLWAKSPLQNEPEEIATILPGDNVTIEIDYNESDLPHQVLSAWEFQVRYASSGGPYNAFFGYTDLKVTALRGYELQPFPAHPDHWGDADELPLVDAEGTFNWIKYTGTGTLPQRIRALEGAIVPPDAQEVNVELTYDNEYPVGGIRLGYHAADTRTITFIEPVSDTGSVMTFEIDVDERGDGPYSTESLWEFLIDTPPTDSTEGAAYSGPYQLTATVHRA